jgi:hypothetical protein
MYLTLVLDGKEYKSKTNDEMTVQEAANKSY